jgi:hypothetical protein
MGQVVNEAPAAGHPVTIGDCLSDSYGWSGMYVSQLSKERGLRVVKWLLVADCGLTRTSAVDPFRVYGVPDCLLGGCHW